MINYDHLCYFGFKWAFYQSKVSELTVNPIYNEGLNRY